MSLAFENRWAPQQIVWLLYSFVLSAARHIVMLIDMLVNKRFFLKLCYSVIFLLPKERGLLKIGLLRLIGSWRRTVVFFESLQSVAHILVLTDFPFGHSRLVIFEGDAFVFTDGRILHMQVFFIIDRMNDCVFICVWPWNFLLIFPPSFQIIILIRSWNRQSCLSLEHLIGRRNSLVSHEHSLWPNSFIISQIAPSFELIVFIRTWNYLFLVSMVFDKAMLFLFVHWYFRNR